jgi:hypothetical protein
LQADEMNKLVGNIEYSCRVSYRMGEMDEDKALAFEKERIKLFHKYNLPTE